MKKIVRLLSVLLALGALASCYEPYVFDYDYPNMGFSLPKQTRTVVSNINKIYVGVSIGGKREVDLNDWATFTFDQSLLNGTGLKMLPESHYVLGDPNTMRPRKTNIAVADVEITFTDAFYADPLTKVKTYALPFRLVGTSIRIAGADEVIPEHGAIRAGKETAIVAIKYISGYSGTYYRLGEMVEVNEAGEAVGDAVTYRKYSLSENATAYLQTESRNAVIVPSAGNGAGGAFLLSLSEDAAIRADVTVSEVEGGATLKESRCSYRREGDYTFYGGDKPAPQFDLEYVFSKDGHLYRVKESLVLRQWPEADLRVEASI